MHDRAIALSPPVLDPSSYNVPPGQGTQISHTGPICFVRCPLLHPVCRYSSMACITSGQRARCLPKWVFIHLYPCEQQSRWTRVNIQCSQLRGCPQMSVLVNPPSRCLLYRKTGHPKHSVSHRGCPRACHGSLMLPAGPARARWCLPTLPPHRSLCPPLPYPRVYFQIRWFDVVCCGVC